MNSHYVFLIGVYVLVSVTLNAQSRTLYSDKATFESTLDSSSIVGDDFTGYPAIPLSDINMSNVLGETRYEATGNVVPTPNIVIADRYSNITSGSFLLRFGSTSASNNGAVYGVGFSFVGNSGSTPYLAYVTYSTLITENVPIPSGSGFWGITSDHRIKSIHIGLADGVPSNAGSFSLDDLTIGAQDMSGLIPPSVPTLSQWGLFLFALIFSTLGLVLVFQRKVVLTNSNQGINTPLTFPFSRKGFVNGLTLSFCFVLIGALLIQLIWGQITALDLFGLLTTMPILAYLLFLYKNVLNLETYQT